MRQKFKLSVDDILDKRFNIDFKGYAAEEVDAFLDSIIADYQTYNEIISELGTILNDFEEKFNNLQEENTALKTKLDQNSSNDVTTSANQLEILRRIARLEEAVFKK